jgi:hypothetical protein
MTDQTETTEPPEVTDERIYEDLKAYKEAGMIDYVLPTEPLGEQWIVGWRGSILKFVTKDSIVGFLTGIQVAALFVADLRGPVRDLREWLREPPQVSAQPVASIRTEWGVAYGGEDASDCAGVLTYDDEGEAAEHVQWVNGGFLASHTVIRTRWERRNAAEDDSDAS